VDSARSSSDAVIGFSFAVLFSFDSIGNTGSRVGIFGLLLGDIASLGLGVRSILRSGDFNCPPNGPLAFSSIGSFRGPNGDTLSCSLSHDRSVGACGGFLGFHKTEVSLTLGIDPGFRASSVLPSVIEISGYETSDSFEFCRLGWSFFCEYDVVLELLSEPGDFGSDRYICRTLSCDGRLFLFDLFRCLVTKKNINVVSRVDAIILPTMAREACVAVIAETWDSRACSLAAYSSQLEQFPELV
jgi:hypothetical protein